MSNRLRHPVFTQIIWSLPLKIVCYHDAALELPDGYYGKNFGRIAPHLPS
jgi:hypothetical protein